MKTGKTTLAPGLQCRRARRPDGRRNTSDVRLAWQTSHGAYYTLASADGVGLIDETDRSDQFLSHNDQVRH